MLDSVVWAYMVVSCFVGATVFELGELSHSGKEFRVCEVILQKNLLLLPMSFWKNQVWKLFGNVCAAI